MNQLLPLSCFCSTDIKFISNFKTNGIFSLRVTLITDLPGIFFYLLRLVTNCQVWEKFKSQTPFFKVKTPASRIEQLILGNNFFQQYLFWYLSQLVLSILTICFYISEKNHQTLPVFVYHLCWNLQKQNANKQTKARWRRLNFPLILYKDINESITLKERSSLEKLCF